MAKPEASKSQRLSRKAPQSLRRTAEVQSRPGEHLLAAHREVKAAGAVHRKAQGPLHNSTRISLVAFHRFRPRPEFDLIEYAASAAERNQLHHGALTARRTPEGIGHDHTFP